jgi:hypothetical protein
VLEPINEYRNSFSILPSSVVHEYPDVINIDTNSPQIGKKREESAPADSAIDDRTGSPFSQPTALLTSRGSSSQ